MLEPIDPNFMPYGPGSRTVDVINRIHEGKSGSSLTLPKLAALGVAQGNAVRVQRSVYFLGLIDEEGELTESAKRLRKVTSDEFPGALAEIVRLKYAAVFEICDPMTASSIDLVNAFRPYEPAGQRDNMIRLFTALCQEAGLMAASDQESKRGRPLSLRKPPFAGATKTTDKNPNQIKDTNPPDPLSPPPPKVDGILFHPAVDAFLREARKLTVGDDWTADARDNVVRGFTTQLELFLPVKKQ